MKFIKFSSIFGVPAFGPGKQEQDSTVSIVPKVRAGLWVERRPPSDRLLVENLSTGELLCHFAEKNPQNPGDIVLFLPRLLPLYSPGEKKSSLGNWAKYPENSKKPQNLSANWGGILQKAVSQKWILCNLDKISNILTVVYSLQFYPSILLSKCS